MAKARKQQTAAKRLRILVEITVERDSPREAAFASARALEAVGFRLDTEYEPVPLRPPPPERERLESAGLQLLLVRGTIDPARRTDLEKHSAAYRVWSDVKLQPFARAASSRRTTAASRLTARARAKGKTRSVRGRRTTSAARRPRTRTKAGAKQGRASRGRQATAGGGFASVAICGGGIGTINDVLTALGVTRIWKRGYRGQGVDVGVVDGGIAALGRPVKPGETAVIPNVVSGWPADWGTTALGWNPAKPQHGNMVAYNVLAVAPEARLWDLRIWEDLPGVPPAERFDVYVSNAIAAYHFAITRFLSDGSPQILTNSWGLYDSANGEGFATDPRSPLALKVEDALDAGMLVLFAAGNCGTGCAHPSTSPCGVNDRGPGASILGPNGHPEVMTVGGADTKGRWYGFTSQGPAVLPPHAAKPDFCSFTQYAGFFPVHGPGFDGGTSAACATAAGVVALLKSYRPTLPQTTAKTVLKSTARDIRAPGIDADSGAGLIRAYLAFGAL